MSEFVQMNLSLRKETANRIEALHKEPGWSKAHIVGLAVDALHELMRHHKEVADDQTEEDKAELYRRVAHELPVELGLNEVGLNRLKTGRPAVLVGGWTITSADDGELVGLRPSDGGFVMATISRGAIRAKASWTAEEAQEALAAEVTAN